MLVPPGIVTTNQQSATSAVAAAVEVGDKRLEIPASSFVPDKSGNKFTFKGGTQGIDRMVINTQTVEFSVKAKGVELNDIGAGGQVVFGLRIESFFSRHSIAMKGKNGRFSYCNSSPPRLLSF